MYQICLVQCSYDMTYTRRGGYHKYTTSILHLINPVSCLFAFNNYKYDLTFSITNMILTYFGKSQISTHWWSIFPQWFERSSFCGSQLTQLICYQNLQHFGTYIYILCRYTPNTRSLINYQISFCVFMNTNFVIMGISFLIFISKPISTKLQIIHDDQNCVKCDLRSNINAIQ